MHGIISTEIYSKGPIVLNFALCAGFGHDRHTAQDLVPDSRKKEPRTSRRGFASNTNNASRILAHGLQFCSPDFLTVDAQVQHMVSCR